MAEPQIDPFKLNDVLEQILDSIQVLKEESSSASPEFQILMNNYLTKANESERNQARLEESLERLSLKDQEIKKIQDEKEELNERLQAFQKSSDLTKKESEKDLLTLREEIAELKALQKNIESEVKEKYQDEIRSTTDNLNKQINYYRNQLSELQGMQNDFDQKYNQKAEEAETLNAELTELRNKVMGEQAQIRQEILEITQRSNSMEEEYHDERKSLVKHIDDLERELETIKTDYQLKVRELEYKNALLDQALKKPQAVMTSEEAQIHQQEIEQREIIETEKENVQSFQYNIPQEESTAPIAKEKEEKVGGIWSKLSS